MKTVLGIIGLCMLMIVAFFLQSRAVATPTVTGHPTVKIVLEGSHGSGVYIGDNLILTAAHVVVAATDGKIKIKTEGGNILSGQTLWMSKERDVALVQVKGTFGLKAAALSCDTPQIGDAIQARGNPLSVEFFSAWGHIAGTMRQMGPWLEGVPTDLTILPGMSGGPIFRTDGRVIGIAVGAMMAPAGMSMSITGATLIVPGSTICPLLGRTR